MRISRLFSALSLSGKGAMKVMCIPLVSVLHLDASALPSVSRDSGMEWLQQISVTGRVTDDAGNALEGVTVRVAGTAQITATAADGSFAIQASKGELLHFSYTGFNAREVQIDDQSLADIVMEKVLADLDEVVVVAYGKQKKETLTGAIATITTKEIKQSPAANLAVTLAGRLPGLTSIQRSGEPGNDFTQLFIRGMGTVNAQSPIVLVDGIERELTYVDPNEIESVTILKDASSTAIFGVRGANGVILITTRRGSSEIPEINFTTEMSSQSFTRFPSVLNSYDYARTRNLMNLNDGIGPRYSDEALEHYRLGDDPLNYPNQDWRKILLNDQALQQRYNLNVSGAGSRVKYFVNAGYLNQGSPFKVEKDLPYDPSFKLNRYSFRSNIDIELNKTLKAIMNLGGYIEKQNMPAGIFENLGAVSVSPSLYIMANLAAGLNATVPGPLTPDGDVLTPQGEFYPAYGQLNRSGYVQQARTNITSSFGLEQNLGMWLEGLSAKAIMSFDTRATNNLMGSKQYVKYYQVINRTPEGEDIVSYNNMGDSRNTPLALSGSRNISTLSNFQGYLNYANTFGNHSITGLVLYQQQKNIVDAQLPFNLRGVSSRLTYGFSNRYFAEFNMGYNGSEQFKKGRRFGFFPAYSVAWVATNEAFMKDVDFLNTLKLRASYGKVGNDRIGSRRFLYLDNIQIGAGGYSSSLGLGQTVNINLLKNEALQWEVANKLNIGLDLRLFDNWDLVVDVFNEKRDNILRNRGTIPDLNGLSNSVLPPVNIGKVENKGYEIELTYRKQLNSDLMILAKLNTAYSTNRQTFADEPLLDAAFAHRYRETGFRIGQNFGYIVDGYFKDENEIANSPVQNVGGKASRPGDFKYRDLNGDNVVDEKDIAPIGYSNVPEYQFGAAFNVSYKKFDVSLLFQGVTNVSNYYRDYGVFPMGGENFRARHSESWTAERQANGERISYPRLTAVGNPSEIQNTFFTNDVSYIRLKNVEVGYTFDNTAIKRMGAQRIRVYANGLNLYTWDRLPVKDFDPEVTGILSFPIPRLVNFGLNFIF